MTGWPVGPSKFPDAIDVTSLSGRERAIAHVLFTHVGRENAVTSSDIASFLGIDESNGNPVTRGLIRDITVKTGVPIASCGEGYFVVADRPELRDYIANLNDRIAGIQRRQDIVVDSYESAPHNAVLADSDHPRQQQLGDQDTDPEVSDA
jgi:hypothetical protein